MWDANVRDVICEVDCLDLEEALRDDRLHFHEHASELQDIKKLLQRSWTNQLVHISRNANEAADCLAALGADRQCSVLRLKVPPPQLQPILARDLLVL